MAYLHLFFFPGDQCLKLKQCTHPLPSLSTGAMAFIVSRSSLLSSHLTTARVAVSFSRLFAKNTEKIMANPKVFFDIAINNQNVGRLVMEVTVGTFYSYFWNLS